MRALSILILLLWLMACSDGQSGGDQSEQQQATPMLPQEIEDIVCGVSYPLVIADIYEQDDTAKITMLTMLHDGNKTNQSNWQATTTAASLVIELDAPALLKALVVSWQTLSFEHGYSVLASKDGQDWQTIVGPTASDNTKLIPDVINLSDGGYTAKFLKLALMGTSEALPSELLEIEVFGCSQQVAHSIELIDWYLSVPTDTDYDGRSDSINELELANGYFDPRFFSLSPDGGLVFSTSVSGYRTSTNTKYVRAELREMLRRGDTSHKTQGITKNNWVFASAPQSDIDKTGGIDGLLEVDMAVNHVTSTGVAYQVGRVIIGQIHANDDEPIRVYYRKLPNNVNGAIYFAHERAGGDDSYYEIIGSRDNNAENPADGIALNERFSYSISVTGNLLTFGLTKADGSEYSQTVDMSQSGYDQGGQYQYFKAGVYNQNNSGDPHDYVRATFYKIDNSHTGYAFSANINQ